MSEFQDLPPLPPGHLAPAFVYVDPLLEFPCAVFGVDPFTTMHGENPPIDAGSFHDAAFTFLNSFGAEPEIRSSFMARYDLPLELLDPTATDNLPGLFVYVPVLGTNFNDTKLENLDYQLRSALIPFAIPAAEPLLPYLDIRLM